MARSTTVAPRRVSGLWHTRSLDRVAQNRRLTSAGRGDGLELHRGAAAVEQPDAVADEHGGDVDDDLVEEPGLEALARDVRAKDDDVVAFGCAFAIAHRPSMPTLRNRPATPFTTGGAEGG